METIDQWIAGRPQASSDAAVLSVFDPVTGQAYAECPRGSAADIAAAVTAAVAHVQQHRAARQLLGWTPRWSLDSCLQQTLDWHQAWQRGEDMRALTLAQLAAYRGAHE